MWIFGDVRITECQRRLERLAWAGGLFDGEGSTMARGETSRPGYRRLNVVVPQRGDSNAPEVLSRFLDAMNGMGKIAEPIDGIYMWRVLDDTPCASHDRAPWALDRPGEATPGPPRPEGR